MSKHNCGIKYLEAFSPVLGSSLRLACSRDLENISKQLAERSDSRSLQIFSATLSYCKSLIINELVWEGEETADYEDRLSLERRITDLTSQLNAEERSTQVTMDKYEAEAIEER